MRFTLVKNSKGNYFQNLTSISSFHILGTTVDGRTTYLTVNHDYTQGQNYTVIMEMWNLVSRETFNFTFPVYEEISDLSLTLVYIDPVNFQPVARDGTSANIYIPTECDVSYNVTYARGTHVTAVFDFGGGDVVSDYQYDQKLHPLVQPPKITPSTGTLTVTASNLISSKVFVTTLHFQTSVNNTNITCRSPYYMKYDTPCYVDLGNLATDVCYFIDWVIPDPDDIQYAYFGNQPQCAEDHPTEMAGSQIVQLNPTMTPDTTIMPRYHNFTIKGPYWVSLTASNKVSRQTPGFRMLVTRGPCWPPEIDLITPNYCDDTGQCEDTSVPLEFWKSVKVIVKSTVKYNCSFSHSGYFHWRVFSINRATGWPTYL